MPNKKAAETELYEPVKRFLQAQNYKVKAEIGSVDIVALRKEEAPVLIEMKTGFSLTLFHQAIERQSISDHVYIAVPRGSGRSFQNALKNNKSLCRRLGLGLLTVRLKDGFVEAHLDPAPYRPRQSKIKTGRLLREFERRVGDPNKGGSTGIKIITAYRQDALRCVKQLLDNGPTKASQIAKLANVERARTIMAVDHYGWFERVTRGIYTLSPKGMAAVVEYADQIFQLNKEQE